MSEESTTSFATECGDSVAALINNGGIMFEASIAEQTVQQWDMAMAVNLRGPWLMTKALLDLLVADGGGAVVNIGSIEGIATNPTARRLAVDRCRRDPSTGYPTAAGDVVLGAEVEVVATRIVGVDAGDSSSTAPTRSIRRARSSSVRVDRPLPGSCRRRRRGTPVIGR